MNKAFDKKSTSFDELYKYYKSFKQEHVFDFWDELNPDQQIHLLNQCSKIDLKQIQDLSALVNAPYISKEHITPPEYVRIPDSKTNDSQWANAMNIGENAIREGRVAAFTPAGGQGTRLGFDAPKGTFPVTTVSQKSLFQVFAEKIKSTSVKYNVEIPWYIMTSEGNYEETQLYFETNKFFELNRSLVRFLIQGTMPNVDFNGKLLMSEKFEIAISPNGHGGSLQALAISGSLDDMLLKGIDIISFFQIDNVLVNCIDPYFIGFHIINKSDISTKTCIKSEPFEKVGLLVNDQNKVITVEYSDLSDELASKRDKNGELLFRCGSIGIHLFDRDFISKFSTPNSGYELPFHLAIKKINSIDRNGIRQSAGVPNGIKFEMFGFDAMEFTSKTTIVETLRSDEFSPVKNSAGNDSPLTAKQDQLRKFTKWLIAAGGQIQVNDLNEPKINFEISPLFANSLEEFIEKYDGRPVTDGTIFEK